MKLSHLRHVVAVAESGSLHAAARHLKTTQPALTRSLRELERDLGAPLFHGMQLGIVDLFVGPLPAEVGREFLVEHPYDQETAILCRKGHPLAAARSLRELLETE